MGRVAALLVAALLGAPASPPDGRAQPASAAAVEAKIPLADRRQEQFVELLRTYPERPPQETFAAVAELVDEGPFKERDRAEYWIGSARLAAGDRDGARAWFGRLGRDYPGGGWEERSWLGLADAAAQERSYGDALDLYARAATARDASVRELSRISAGQVRLLRLRQRVAWALGFVALGIAAFLAYRGRSSLWPAPAEVRIVAPVLAVLALMSWRIDPAPRKTVLELCVAGLALVWTTGSARALGKALQLSLGVAALACVAYVAVYRGDLIGMVMETVRVGPE